MMRSFKFEGPSKFGHFMSIFLPQVRTPPKKLGAKVMPIPEMAFSSRNVLDFDRYNAVSCRDLADHFGRGDKFRQFSRKWSDHLKTDTE